jgi:hypothetical protein
MLEWQWNGAFDISHTSNNTPIRSITHSHHRTQVQKTEKQALFSERNKPEKDTVRALRFHDIRFVSFRKYIWAKGVTSIDWREDTHTHTQNYDYNSTSRLVAQATTEVPAQVFAIDCTQSSTADTAHAAAQQTQQHNKHSTQQHST